MRDDDLTGCRVPVGSEYALSDTLGPRYLAGEKIISSVLS